MSSQSASPQRLIRPSALVLDPFIPIQPLTSQLAARGENSMAEDHPTIEWYLAVRRWNLVPPATNSTSLIVTGRWLRPNSRQVVPVSDTSFSSDAMHRTSFLGDLVYSNTCCPAGGLFKRSA